MRTFAKLTMLATVPLLAACAGGGAGQGTAPANSQSALGGKVIPAVSTSPPPTSTPTAVPTQTPPPNLTALPDTWGRIAPMQIFDDFPTTGTHMTDAEITADAHRYPGVWGSFNPHPWTAAKPKVLVSHYYVPPEDSNLMSGHDLTWWQQNHPDWILYTCDANNNPTMEIAYVPGIGFPDVPLDIHNPDVIKYQILDSLGPYLIANGYNTAAFDQINFNNILVGGNPELGQKIIPGYFACGVYQNGTFVRRYQSKSDPQYAADMINWLNTMRTYFKTDPNLAPHNLKVFVNHTVQSTSDPNENQLLNDVDMELDETGFSDYGFYQKQGNSGLFYATVNWMRWLQSHNIAITIIDKFDQENVVTQLHQEYSMATYLMGKEQGGYIFTVGANGPGYGYGAEQWHPEYLTAIGKPCQEMYGGPRYDPNNPQIWYRRFANGMAVVNSGSLPLASENATLPANHTYTDVFGRTVTNPLSVASNDAYLLTTAKGTGCL